MQSNYKAIGPYIQMVDVRNKEGVEDNLLGVSVSKLFISSIANTVGTDFTKYKIVKKDQFTYIPDTSRRGDKMGIALLENYEEALVSQAYTVFEIVDKEKLDPAYLMMWFRRPEFDRYARFKSHGSVREIFDWVEMCQVKLPIPSIEKQREIVAEYNTVKNRIVLNNQFIQKLEETAQAIYKQWFVDFEFPDEMGKPYKSSGGKMVFNEELDKEIPERWEVSNIENICEIIDGDRGINYPSQEFFLKEGYCLFLNAGNVSKVGFNFSSNIFISKERDELLRKGKLKRRDVVLTTRGTVGNVAYYSEFIDYSHLRINSGMVILRPKNEKNSLFVYSLMRSQTMKENIENYLSGSAQPQLPITDLKRIPVIIPTYNLISIFSEITSIIQNHIELGNIGNRKMQNLKNLLLSKLATIKN